MLGKMPVASGSNHVFQLAEIKWGNMATRLLAIKVTRKSGKKCFQGMDGERALQDFWAWAFSDLVSNTERGKLAECIVATAMGCDGGTSPHGEVLISFRLRASKSKSRHRPTSSHGNKKVFPE